MFPYLVLLRVGFSLPLNVATSAVGSYPTISTLPDPALERTGHRRYIFCATFHRLAASGC